jgi:hypothetical protein
MSRKIEVELTSDRGDGSWTWRAAGAKQPKGDLDARLLYPGAKVGDVVRAEADFDVDGIVVVAVQAPREKPRDDSGRIELLGPPQRAEGGVTTSLAPKARRGERRGRREGGDREARTERRERGEGRRDRSERGEGRRDRRERSERGEGRRESRGRPERPAAEARPKAPRLRAGRTHRHEVLASLPEEHKPIAEQVLKGGIPAVRQAVEKQNEANRAEGRPEISPDPIVAIAEQLLPKLRTAEWHDRAEAALASIEQVDLRDLRSVVVAADVAARDDTTRQLAADVREGLERRVEHEQREWLAELDTLLRDGRVVRALRVSSRPPKAGFPLPADLAARLAEGASSALTTDTGTERFATVLDALAHSPVRQVVRAQGLPDKPGDELLAAVRKLSSQLPQIAEQFGVEPVAAPTRRGGRGARKPPPPPPPRPPEPAPDTASANGS